MRKLVAVGAAVLFMVALVAAEPAADSKDNIEGSWDVVGVNNRGKAIPQDKVKGTKFVFTKDKVTLTGAGKEVVELSYKHNPTANPKTIDMSKDGKSAPGIYKLSGDTLTISLAQPETAPRPETFEAKEGAKQITFTMERKKK